MFMPVYVLYFTRVVDLPLAQIGLAFTIMLLPETKGKTLEELGEAAMGRVAAITPATAATATA